METLEQLLLRLQSALAWADVLEGLKETPPGRLSSLVARRGPIKLAIYAERHTHKRPHFHLHYKTEFAASYALDDFSLLAGSMPRRYEGEILAWARENVGRLMEAWEQVNAGDPPEPLVLAHGARND